MKHLAILISNGGTGTNLQAIIDAIESKKINAKISVVVSDREDAPGLNRAKKHKLQTEINFDKKKLLSILKKYNVDYIALAGWKQIVTNEVMREYKNKILNVHPGLIPNTMDGKVKTPDGSLGLWNKGKYTVKAIKNFFDNHATYAGCTVHFLTNEFDFGPVLGRGFVKINSHDTIDSLYDQVKEKEHELYITALQKLCEKKQS